jgi:cysteinyl-tRNA synthetase
MLKIYNSLTNQKEDFVPLDDKKVRMYACGVTVYDECHIGHARAAFVFDFIRKYLVFSGYEVTFVRNITDIDDKIINKAREALALTGGKKSLPSNVVKEKVKEIAFRFTKKFYEDMKALNIDHADVEPKATEHINEMIELIKILIRKGYAYESGGDVYFEVKKFKNYGKLSNQSIEQMLTGVRKESEPNKKNPLDFALWKKSKEDEPAWHSPWSEGRPGWHIECSVMSMKYLGQSFDIHAGGRDLIFPHHENEIAQSEAATGKTFAKYWIHNGLLTIGGEKMAKSLGNFVSIKDVLAQYHPEVLKIFFLNSHYSSPVDFTSERMEAAKSSRQRFYILFKKIDEIISPPTLTIQKTPKEQEIVKAIKTFLDELHSLRERFKLAMDDDFNTPGALSALFDIVNLTNKFIEEGSVPLERKKMALQSAKFTLIELGRVLGLFVKPKKEEEEDMQTINELMKIIIEVRDYARSKKDYLLSDKIRAQLKEIGIILEDTKGKTTWRKED